MLYFIVLNRAIGVARMLYSSCSTAQSALHSIAAIRPGDRRCRNAVAGQLVLTSEAGKAVALGLTNEVVKAVAPALTSLDVSGSSCSPARP